jgi:hypothetical protein
MKVIDFMRSLRGLHTPNAFNPYTDTCVIYDIPGAAQSRAAALQAILEHAVERRIDAIWVGRDLGYRGGRRTGLALTDDMHCKAHGARWGVEVRTSTKGPAIAERTAGAIWKALSQIDKNVFLWNAYPLHPHLPGVPLSNRAHSSGERALGEKILADLVVLLNPARLVAIGKDAAVSAIRCSGGRPVCPIRHPSYGGQREFFMGISALYNTEHKRTVHRP